MKKIFGVLFIVILFVGVAVGIWATFQEKSSLSIESQPVIVKEPLLAMENSSQTLFSSPMDLGMEEILQAEWDNLTDEEKASPAGQNLKMLLDERKRQNENKE